jgi:hypothetical protein
MSKGINCLKLGAVGIIAKAFMAGIGPVYLVDIPAMNDYIKFTTDTPCMRRREQLS